MANRRAQASAGTLLVIAFGLALWLPAGFGLVYVQRGLASRHWLVVTRTSGRRAA